MPNTKTAHYNSPMGMLLLEASDRALTGIHYINEEATSADESVSGLLSHAINQLNEYFEGTRTAFDIPLAPRGTKFQQEVWQQLREIPYGQTISYGVLAERLGDPKKVRAVGTANGKNPIPIIIPCHRVIGADDSLVGYSGGIDRKEYLLKHEGVIFL